MHICAGLPTTEGFPIRHRRPRVDVSCSHDFRSVVAEVSDIQGEVIRKAVLDIHVPGFHIGDS